MFDVITCLATLYLVGRSPRCWPCCWV